ncbi:MAG: L,D-transpeptidase [Erysipelotrichaceae bacterium]|nr:L,D-transpeptidase [Erysipelotrichaceae bacterium]
MKKTKVLITVLAILLLLAGGYLGGILFFQSHFLPRTRLNSIDVSMKSLEEAEDLISADPIPLTLVEKNSNGNSTVKEVLLLGQDVKAEARYDAESLLEGQNIFTWFTSFFKDSDLTCKKAEGSYDETSLKDFIGKLYCLQERNIKEPSPAHLEINEGILTAVEADDGSLIKEETLRQQVTAFVKAFLEGSGTDTLDLTSFYETADHSDISVYLEQQREKLQPVLDKTVTIVVSESITVPLAGRDMQDMLVLKDNELFVDEDKLEPYVKALADKYDISETLYINRPSLRSSLRNSLLAATNSTVYASWSTESSSSSSTEIPSTGKLIDVDYSEQTLRYYENGNLIFSSDIVTGNAATYTIIDYGTYYVQRKKQGATLRGSDYTEYVDFWIGFGRSGHYSDGGGILGIHDASWRSEFGGDIWLSDPSHGCVNMPRDNEERLYNAVDIGTEIHIHE